jgi:hypothetical protein
MRKIYTWHHGKFQGEPVRIDRRARMGSQLKVFAVGGINPSVMGSARKVGWIVIEGNAGFGDC